MTAVGNWANYGVTLTRPHREPWRAEGAATRQGEGGPQRAVHFRGVETEAHCGETGSCVGWGRASMGGLPGTQSGLRGGRPGPVCGGRRSPPPGSARSPWTARSPAGTAASLS